MNCKIITMAIVLAIGLTACEEKKESSENHQVSENPLLKESTLDYHAPDFSKIKNKHYKPAMLEGMRLQSERVQQIADNSEPPTFDNTIVALEKSGAELERVSNVFFALTSANTNDLFKELQKELAPKLSAHQDAIQLNSNLFQRIKTLYDTREELNLEAEEKKLLENYYENFVIAGANLSDGDKEKLKNINAQLAELQTEFNQILLEANNSGALVIDNKDKLKGLTESQIKSLKSLDSEEWKIPLLNTTQQPLLSSLEDRKTRQELFQNSWNRAQNGTTSTKEVILKIVKARIEKANLLGFDNFAAWSLQKTMAKTPERIMNFFQKLVPAATAKALEEAEDIQKMIKTEGGDFDLEPYDWNFYAEKVRKQRYDLDESQIKPYFELKTVLEKGVFFAATKLYGITFKKRTDIPVYHPDVMVYELLEEDGSSLGLFYADYFARQSKRGGAWMSNFVTQSDLYGYKPVIYNVCNYTKPAEGEPALLTYDEVSTMFHEFGHALHGFFASQKFPSLSGTSVARDFVEYPSQFNENWALYPEVLKNYAIHYKTGEVIPQELIDKIKKAGTFNQGYSFTELLAASNLDLKWHTLTADTNVNDVDAFEKEALESTKLYISTVPPRYRSTYFSHIFGGGYAAGYYSYQWTEMLAHDTYDWFEENGGLTRENGQRYRDMILSRGNTLDYAKMYKDFRGSAPKIQPLLKARGLN